MENQIEITATHETSNVVLLLELLTDGEYAEEIKTKLGKEKARKLRSYIESAALTDANNIRKEAHVAVVKLSAALETTTRLLADAQKRLEEAEKMVADLSRKTPEA
jgi:hypothetical protein